MDAPGRMLRYRVAAGGRVRTEQLCDALWPDATSDAAGTRLRTVLFRTRTRYGPLLVRDGSVIRWADDVTVDTQRFTELAHAALSRLRGPEAATLAREAIALYSADLVPLDPYSDWAIVARERMRDRYLALLDPLVAEATDRDDLPTAIGYAREILATAPRDDDAHLRLARLQLDAGRITQARETISRARSVAAELELPASPALDALERRLGSTGAQP
jgi:DNA-binding SARP family transcriptional activator